MNQQSPAFEKGTFQPGDVAATDTAGTGGLMLVTSVLENGVVVCMRPGRQFWLTSQHDPGSLWRVRVIDKEDFLAGQ